MTVRCLGAMFASGSSPCAPAGVPMIIVSNNSYDRVKPFADALSLDFVSMGMKPLTFGFTKAQKKMNLPVQDIAVVGDHDLYGYCRRKSEGDVYHPCSANAFGKRLDL